MRHTHTHTHAHLPAPKSEGEHHSRMEGWSGQACSQEYSNGVCVLAGSCAMSSYRTCPVAIFSVAYRLRAAKGGGGAHLRCSVNFPFNVALCIAEVKSSSFKTTLAQNALCGIVTRPWDLFCAVNGPFDVRLWLSLVELPPVPSQGFHRSWNLVFARARHLRDAVDVPHSTYDFQVSGTRFQGQG